MDTSSLSGSNIGNLHRTASLSDMKSMSMAQFSMNEFGDLIGRSRRMRNADEVSDTSSQQERKFANLLGGENEESDFEDDGYTHQPTRNVGHRLYREGAQRERIKKERMQEVREQILLQEMAQLTQRPSITSRARQKPGKGILFSDHAMVWSQKKEENRRKAKRQVISNEMKEHTGTPSLNPHSEDIIDESAEYSGPVSGWDAHFAKFCAKRSVAVSPQMFTPNINANAVRVDVDKSITDRLYDDSMDRTLKMKERAVERRKAEHIDPATGQPLFTPQALRAPSEVKKNGSQQRYRSADEVTEWLYGSKNDREERIKKLEEKQRDSELTFSPSINKRSQALGDKHRKPLYTPNMRKPDRSPDPKSRDPDYTGQPMTLNRDPNNSTTTATASDVQEFLRRTERCDHVRQAKLSAVKKQIQEKDEAECTFQPRINPKSEEIFRSTNVHGVEMASPGAAQYSARHHHRSVSQDPPSSIRQPRFSEGATSHHHSFQQHSPVTASQPQTARSRASVTPPHHNQPRQSPAPSYHQSAKRVSATPREQPRPRSLSPNHPHATPTAAPAAAPMNTSAAPQGETPQVDEYISTFEKQMYAVLDEWRKLEDI